MTESMTSAEFLEHMGPEKDAARVIAGRNARADGEDFEKQLDQAHMAYLNLGVASIDRLPVPTSPMPGSWLVDRKKCGLARLLAKKQGFDFYGSLGPEPFGGKFHGRAVAMEGKATKDFKTSLGVGDGGPVRPHQVEALANKYRLFGTMVGIVWRNGDLRGVMLGPQIVTAWQAYRLKQRKSLPWSGFAEYPVHAIDAGGPIEDWLAPVLMHAAQEAIE